MPSWLATIKHLCSSLISKLISSLHTWESCTRVVTSYHIGRDIVVDEMPWNLLPYLPFTWVVSWLILCLFIVVGDKKCLSKPKVQVLWSSLSWGSNYGWNSKSYIEIGWNFFCLKLPCLLNIVLPLSCHNAN